MTEPTPEVPGWARDVPTYSRTRAELPQPQWDEVSQDSIEQSRRKLRESLFESIVLALKGFFLPGPVGVAFDQLAEWGNDLITDAGKVIGNIGNVVMDGVETVGSFLNGMWDAFTGGSGSTNKSVANVKTAATAITSTANTGVTNAATAQTTANTANTDIQATVDHLSDAFLGTTGSANTSKALMRTRGAAVRTSAVTGEANSGTALTNAATAQGTANTAIVNAAAADAKAVTAQLMLDQKIIGGSSITTNPSFEDTTQILGSSTQFTYSTDQAFVGTRSAKFLSTAQYVALYGTTNATTSFGVAAAPTQVYYFEVMVRRHASNTLTTGSTNIVLIAYFDGASAIIVNEKGPTQITSTGWYKLAGYVTVPAGAVTIRPRVDIRAAIPAGDIYYFDSFRAVDVTDAYAAKVAADAAQATANTAVTNAATADGKAVVADGKAVTASTNLGTLSTNLSTTPQNVLGSIANVVMDGVSSVGNFLSGIWDAFTGGSGSSGKTIANVKTAATAVTSTANTASTNASAAVTSAGTANTDIQTTVDYLSDAFLGTTGSTGTSKALMRTRGAAVRTSAVTGEANAGTALTNAATAQTQANLGVTNAAAADTKAVTAQNAATAAQAAVDSATALLNASVTAGANLIPDPSFEDSTLDAARKATSGSVASWWNAVTDVVKSGSRAMEVTFASSGAAYPSLNLVPSLKSTWSSAPSVRIPCKPGQVFYMSQWVYLRSPNSGTREMNLYLATFNQANTIQYQFVQAFPALDTWVKIEGYFVVSRADVVSVAPLFGAFRPGQQLNAKAVVDDVVMIDVTDAYNAKVAADAAQATANTGVTNAAAAQSQANLGVTNAGIAQGAANAADTKALVAQNALASAINSGANLCANSGFENIDYKFLAPASTSYATDLKRSGTRSAKIIGITGQNLDISYFASTTNGNLRLPVQAGDVLYFEAWIRGGTGNTKTAGAIRPYLYSGDPAVPTVSYPANIATYAGTLVDLNAGWQKLSGYYTVPAGGVGLEVVVQLHTSAGTGCILHVDDMVCYRVTEGFVADGKAVAAQAQANTATTNAATADGKAVVADGKAVTADGKAVTAQTNLGTLSTNLSTTPQNVLGSIANVIMDGVSSVGNFLSGIWDAFTGGSGSSGKTIANVKTAATAVTSTANTASTNASAAVTSAGTANTDIQTTVDYLSDAFLGTTGSTGTSKALMRTRGAAVRTSAVTGEANAGTALTNAATAQTQANLGVTNAAAADGKAVAAQGFATSALRMGPNILPNGTFENTSFYTGNGVYDTAVKLSGSYSCRLTGSGVRINLTTGFQTSDTFANSVPCRPSATFYVEGWVYGAPGNTGGGSVQIYIDDYNTAGVLQPQQYVGNASTTAWRSVWTKVSATITVSAAAGSVYIFAYQAGQPAGDVYYYDNFVAYEITEAKTADGKAVAAQATANTGVTNAATAQTQANLGVTNAGIADGKAVTAQGTADTATTTANAALPKTTFDASNSGGSNLATNPSFEDTSQYLWANSQYSTDYARTGTRSAKLTAVAGADRYVSPINATGDLAYVSVVPGQVFYVEFWMYQTGGTVTSAGDGSTSVLVQFFNGAKVYANVGLSTCLLGSATAHNGVWTKVSGTFTAPAGAYNTMRMLIRMANNTAAGTVRYYDDVVIRDVTEAYIANLDADAAQATANTGVTNAATAQTQANLGVTNAGIADGKAVVAQSFASTAITSGNNLVSDPLCLNNNMFQSSMYSSDVAYSGTRSIKTTGTQSKWLIVDNVGLLDVPCVPGDVFYLEMWAYGKTTNTLTAGLLYLSVVMKNGAKATVAYGNTPYMNANPTRNGVWTKASAYVTVPANVAFITAIAVADSVAAGQVYYFSDCKMYRVTEGYVADTKAVTAQTFVDAVAKSSDNRVISPDFEDTTIARYGYAGGSGNTLTYDTAEKFSGLRSLKVTVTSPGWNGPYFGPGQATKWQHTVKPGDVMYASVMFKPAATNNSAVGYVGLWMRYTGDGTTVDAGNVSKNNNTMTGGWEKLETYSTVPAGKTTLEFFFLCDSANVAGTAYWLDDVVLRNVTEARAAQTTADTAVTNAATADGKAVVAQGLSTTAMASGSNLLTNFGFENTNFANAASLSTEQAYQGTRSFKFTVTPGATNYFAPFQALNGAGTAKFQAVSGDAFYFEMMIFPHASNVTGSTLTAYIRCDTPAGAQVATPGFTVTTSTLTKGQWNKVSGYMNVGNVPTSANGVMYLSLPSTEGNNIYYVDNAALFRISESQNIIDNVVQGIAGGTSTGNTFATLKTNAFNVQATAADGVTKANTADGKAVVAQTVATTALKTGWNLVPNDSFEDSTIYLLASGGSYSTVQARSGTRSLRLAGSGQPYSYLFGTTTATYYLPCKPGDVFRYSYWVYGDSSNTVTATLRFGINCRTNTGASIGTANAVSLHDTSAPTSFNNVWTQVTGTITLTTDTTISQFDPYIQRFTTTGGTFYFDDVVLERITESNTAKVAADAAQTSLALKSRDFSNLAAGSDFEGITNPWVLSAGSLALDTAQKNSGTQSLKLSAGAGTRTAHLGVYPTLFEVKPGEQFYVEFYARRSASYAATTGSLRVEDQVNNLVGEIGLNTGADALEGYVSALLHFDGLDGSTTIIFDSSISPYEWTAFGDAQLTTAQSRFGGSSLSLGSSPTGGYIKATSPASDFAFGTDNFTIELWFRTPTVTGTTDIFYDSRPNANGAYPLLYHLNGQLRYFVNGDSRIIGSTLAVNTWYHIAVSRVSGVTRMFLNGVQQGSSWTDTTNYLPSQPIIGRSGLTSEAGTYDTVGFVDDVRITKGMGRYSANFTAPTAAFPDGAQNFAGVDTWSKFSGTFTVPANDTGLSFSFQFDSTQGDLWIDDVVIRKVIQTDAIGSIPQSKIDGLPDDVTVSDTLATHSQKILDLESTLLATESQGKSMSVNFATYPDGALTDFTVDYSGTGTSTIGVVSGSARWTYGTVADRTARIVYTGNANENGKTLTNFQSLKGTLGSIPGAGSSTTNGPRFWAIARVSDDRTSYVWARAVVIGSSILNLKAEMGCTVNGVETIWRTNIPLTWSLDMTFLAGANGNERAYQVYSGTTLVAAYEEGFANLAAFPSPGTAGRLYVANDTGLLYTWNGSAYLASQSYANLASFPGTGVASRLYVANDTGLRYTWNGTAYVSSTLAASLLGDSTATSNYRRWGAITEVKVFSGTLRDGGSVASAVTTDNAVSPYKGSVARMVRTSTTAVSFPAGETVVPPSFFITEYETLDVDSDDINGIFTVAKSKMYMVTARIRLTTYVDAVVSVNLQVRLAGSSTWTRVQRGSAKWNDDWKSTGLSNGGLTGSSIDGTWLQYLNAGDSIRLTTQRAGGSSSVLTGSGSSTGVAAGSETYFGIAGLT